MTEKIKGGDQILNTDLTVNYDLKNKDFSENIPAGNLTRTSSSNKSGNYPVPRQVSVNGVKGEAPDELHRRILLEAASRAGLDGSEEQQRFVERFLGGLKYTSSEADPSKDDDTKVKTSDIKNQSFDYNLNPKEIEALRQLQADYKARGGQLGDGKVYDYSTEGRNLTSTEKRNGKRGITTEQYEQWKMQDLLRKAQILPSAFGTPSKLRDLKHISGVELPDIPGKSAEDRALAGLIERQYGGGNLWGDNKLEILELAKTRGVKVENLEISNGKASFDISVENLLKLHHTYIGVQEEFNTSKEIADKAVDKMALNQFLIGMGEGAWDTLKSNWKMLTHPVQTFNEIKEAVSALTNLSQEDLQKVYENLKAEGYKFVFEKDVSEVSRDMGKVVGSVLVELALGKGAGMLLKAFKGTKYAAQMVEVAKDLKQTLGKIPIPTSASIKVVVDTMGNKMAFPDVELTKLGDLIKPLESRAQKIFSSSGKLIDDALVQTAKEKVRNLVKNGDAQELKAFLKETYQKNGYQLYDELKTTVAKTIEENYGVRKMIDLDEMLGGHLIEKHVGKSDNWLKKRLLDEGIPVASTFRNKEIANRTIAKFLKDNKAEIEKWLKNANADNRFQQSIEMDEVVGNILERGKGGIPNAKSSETGRAWVVLVKDSYSAQGWHVETGFPIPKGKFNY